MLQSPLALQMFLHGHDVCPETWLKNGLFSPPNSPPRGTTAWHTPYSPPICIPLMAQLLWTSASQNFLGDCWCLLWMFTVDSWCALVPRPPPLPSSYTSSLVFHLVPRLPKPLSAGVPLLPLQGLPYMQTSSSPDWVLGSKPCVGGGRGCGQPVFDAADQEWRAHFFFVHMLTSLSHRIPTYTTIIEICRSLAPIANF